MAPVRTADLLTRLDGATVAFAVPSFNEGAGIVHTLESLAAAASACGLPQTAVYLSDSSATSETVDSATDWAADRAGVELYVDRSETRRAQKLALNVIFDRSDADILIVTNADVILPAEAVFTLLWDLTRTPQPDIAVGIAAADPGAKALRYRASAWQLGVVGRFASSLPDDARRADGALWAAWRRFYSTYRYPVGSGSIADDVELLRHVTRNGIPVFNSWRARAYKLPAGSFHDFSLQTKRSDHVLEGRKRRPGELRAALLEGAHDPLGAACYALARAATALEGHRGKGAVTEHWEPGATTKR